jgi:Mor family transcriptional regulator
MVTKKEKVDVSETISLESLPEDLQMIAEALNIEAAMKMAKCFGGMRIYIPKIEGLLRNDRDEQVRKEFNGGNHRKLAQKYKLSESRIRTIVQKRSKPLK